MNIDKRKNVDSGYVLAAIIALIGCIYVIAVSFGSIREANAAEIEGKILEPEVAEISMEGETVIEKGSDDADITDNISGVDKKAIDDAEASDFDIAKGESELLILPLKKKVVLLDNQDNQFDEVCFTAADDSIFMSYGWVGLAQQALTEIGDKRSIDDIKINLVGNCDDYIGEPIHLEYNPTVITIANEDF